MVQSHYTQVVSSALMYTMASTPVVESVTPASGRKGTRLRVKGRGLKASSNPTEILIGAAPCVVDESTITSLSAECVVGSTPGGSHTVYVTVGGRGTARLSGTAGTFASDLQITSTSVTSGSFGGATTINIEGHGFGGGKDARRSRRGDGAWGGWIIYDKAGGDNAVEELGTKIRLCNTNCTVTKSSYSKLTCVTDPLHSVESISAFNNLEPEKLADGQPISSNSGGNSSTRAFDGDFTSFFEGTPKGSACWVGTDLGADAKTVVTRFRFFPVHQKSDYTDGGFFETSADFKTWQKVATVEGPHQGWNWVDTDIKLQTPGRYIRYRGPPGKDCLMTQLEFYGYKVAAKSECPVEVGITAPLSHPSHGPMTTDHKETTSKVFDARTFTYEAQKTGTVTSVYPRYGSSLGGEKVTITGENLAVSNAEATVEINGKPCTVESAESDGTKIICTTTARGGLSEIRPVNLIVGNTAAGMGDAVHKIGTRFRYLDRWSAVNTWLDDEPPIEGDFVTIPEDQSILLDESPPKLLYLLVLGTLVFDRQDLNLDATYILVQGGVFEVGTEDEPFMNKATITLHGDRRKTIELPFIGSKVLAVADKGGFTTHGKGKGVDVPLSQKGVLDIHGAPRARTWTHVEKPVPKGSTRIETSEETDFAPGEKIVLTAPHEELIVATRESKFVFTVTTPTQNAHASEQRSDSGFDIDMRCEVALLSRNIIIQGAGMARGDGTETILESDTEKSSESQLFGAHTGAFHGGHYRIENTELRHCGQAGNLGRYCMHYHVNDDNPPPHSYIKSNSIHHSFQRATTVHSTHHALVQNNVAYHVMGHTYFIEDGDETFNVFENNIGIFTRPHHMMLKSDKSPATFWTAIPTNLWRHNVATDSSSRGFWFELKDQGITLEFFNNTLHDNTGIGFRNYPNYSPPSPQYFHNNTYFKNGGNGVFYKKGGDNHHVFSKFAENGVDLFWTKYKTNSGSKLIPNVKDCMFWGGRGAQAIFGPQQEYWYVDGATFKDYGNGGVLSACAGCCTPTKFRQGAYTFRFENLVWKNSAVRTKWTCPYKQIFYDLDGSLSGYRGGTVLPFYKFNEWDGECTKDPNGKMYSAGRAGMVCNEKVRVRRLQLWDNEPRELDDKKISLKKSELSTTNLAGKIVDRHGKTDKFGTIDWEQYKKTGLLYEGTCSDKKKKVGGMNYDFSGCDAMDGLDWITFRQAGIATGEYDGWAIPVVTNHDYYVDIDWHIDFQKLQLRWSEPFYFQEPYNQPLNATEIGEVKGESVMLRWPYVDYR